MKHKRIFVLKNEGKLSELTQDLKDSLDKMNTSKTKTHTVSINNLAIIQVVKKVSVMACLIITSLIFLNIQLICMHKMMEKLIMNITVKAYDSFEEKRNCSCRHISTWKLPA